MESKPPIISPAALEPIVEEKRLGLPTALIIAIVIALIFTVASLVLYYNDARRTDLSRPRFESARQEVTNNQSSANYDTSSPITIKAIDEAIKELEAQKKKLSSYGRFDSSVLDDSSLGLSDDMQPADPASP